MEGEKKGFSLKKIFFGKVQRKILFPFLLVSIIVGVAATLYIFVTEGQWVEIIGLEASLKMRLYAIITALFIIVPSIIIGFVFSRRISKPIEEIEEVAKELEKGNFDVLVNIKTNDEFEILAETFNKTAKILKQRDEEHKEIDKAKTEFLSITSHELRSPMTPMKAQLQMLMKEYFGKINSKQKEALDIVLRNTDRLDRIILDFLEISRIEAARLKFHFVKTNLTEHINRLIEEMNGFMSEKNIKIIKKIGKLPIIEVDPDRVMQVLRNLINNAKKFSPENSKIFVEAKLEGDMILFSVKDQGIGINSRDKIRIFEPFFQAEQTIYREHGGTGLGLAICKGIVNSQNGKIWVESREGKGSTFYFTIPLKPVREIKPIKLLFSPKTAIENKIKKVFMEIIGPLGNVEFDDLKQKSELNKDELISYINRLFEKNIFDEEKAEIFKSEILSIFSSEIKKGVGLKELKEKKLIKTKRDKTFNEKLKERGMVK